MNENIDPRDPAPGESAPAARAIFPVCFYRSSSAVEIYLRQPAAQKLLLFFQNKGLSALKEEDRLEKWYDDWLDYQTEHHLYASLLSPRSYSTLGGEFNLLNLTRFIEVFAYCSPAHGYSFQVSFLGIFSILMGTNADLKKQAVAELETGGLFAFGVSEKNHGSDLLANQFTIEQTAAGQFVANGNKYYIGNANCAAIISVLARKLDRTAAHASTRPQLVLFALRSDNAARFTRLRKIRTLGVRAGFVGEFEVKDYQLSQSDLIAEGRKAWDAVLGTVTLGKFLLGFGQIGICERALEEARDHLGKRILFGHPAIAMPHLRSAMAQAYIRLTAMKLYAYRALDYVQISSPADRRYLLFTAVQKARVGTEGVKVIALLSECIGAKGFEADTYFEMALRDSQLIPSLESSAHINLALTAQFIPAYFDDFDAAAVVPQSMFAGRLPADENSYLMEATQHRVHTIRFPDFLTAYRPLMAIPNVRIFTRQVVAFSLFIRRAKSRDALLADPQSVQSLGACLATISYAQLIAENSLLLRVAAPVISAIFHLLVSDLSVLALSLATLPILDPAERTRIRRLIVVPHSRGADWDFMAGRMVDIS